MQNALPYIILMLLYAVLANIRYFTQQQKTKVYIDCVSIAVFVFFFGLRGFVKYDWVGYYPAYMDLKDLSTLFSTPFADWTWEPGYMIFATICHMVFGSWQPFVFLLSVIDIALLARFFRKFNISLPLGIMVFMAMFGVAMTMDTIRNIVAILLFCNAIPYIIERKPVQYFAICLLGCTIHKTMFVFFPFYFFIHRRINRWILLGIFLASCAVYVKQIPIVKSILLFFAGYFGESAKLYFNTYMDFDKGGSVLSIGFIERLITGFVVFFYIDRLRAIRKGNDVFINCLYIFLYLFLLLSEFRTVSMRSAMLFSFSYWIVWIDLIKCMGYRNNKLLFIAFITVYCLLKAYSENNASISKYENVIFPHMNYNERLIYFRQHFYDK